MMRALRRYFEQRNPAGPRWRVLWWEFVVAPFSWLVVFTLYRQRWWGARNIPATGPVVLVSNHQSYLDLLIIGSGVDHRHFNPMARDSLFHNPFFGWLITSLNAFPVHQGKGDVKSVRVAINLLNQGHLLLVFPEGSRTPDGLIHTFSHGLMLLLKRTNAVVVPMAIDGAYEAWPIGRPFPRLRGQIGSIYGQPIPASQLLAMSPLDAAAFVQRRVELLRLDLRNRLRLLTQNRYPRPGDADIPTLDIPPSSANNAPL